MCYKVFYLTLKSDIMHPTKTITLNLLPIRRVIQCRFLLNAPGGSAGSGERSRSESRRPQDVQNLLRETVQRGAQAKAHTTPPLCPICQQKLSRLSADHPRTFDTRFVPIAQNTERECASLLFRRLPVGRPSVRGNGWGTEQHKSGPLRELLEIRGTAFTT